MSDDHDDGRVEKLQTLAARKCYEPYNEKAFGIVEPMREQFRARREEIAAQLELEEKKALQKIEERRQQMLAKCNDEEQLSIEKEESKLLGSDEAKHLLHMENITYCKQCKLFSEHKNPCSVNGCDWHMRCSCEMDSVTIDPFLHDELRDEHFDMFAEQLDNRWAYWGSWSESCWICKSDFCKIHFAEHYRECREKASCRCGFRAGTYGNRGTLCQAGHCGRDVCELGIGYSFCHRKSNEWDDERCGTLTCDSCQETCYECDEICCRDYHILACDAGSESD